jgi:hypothetical protein
MRVLHVLHWILPHVHEFHILYSKDGTRNPYPHAKAEISIICPPNKDPYPRISFQVFLTLSRQTVDVLDTVQCATRMSDRPEG